MTNIATMKPMLACSQIPDINNLKYPLYASPKLDGIRCLMVDGLALSRQMKRIPNRHVFNTLQSLQLHGLDGELMLPRGDFNNAQSAFMSHGGKPDFAYHVFDDFAKRGGFEIRYQSALEKVKALGHPNIHIVPQYFIKSAEELKTYWDACIKAGYEGVITRAPGKPYKSGRSTRTQEWMMKLKHFDSSEAVVVGFEEMLHNSNEPELDVMGNTVRSKRQEGLITTGFLGALIVTWQGQTFKIGTGFDLAQRLDYWGKRQDLLGRKVTFKYQEVSKYGVPRFPVWLGFRHEDDIS